MSEDIFAELDCRILALEYEQAQAMAAEMRKGLPKAAARKVSDKIERRYLDRSLAGAEYRSAEAGGKIRGYAAVFNSETQLYPGMREKIAPGAFADAIRNDDVRALINHDPNKVLGRSKAGTLALREDGRGLWYEITPPDTQAARDLITSIRRGDITQSSFGFSIVDQALDKRNGDTIRTVKKAKLFDISVVTFAAYPQTEGVTAYSG